jgi:hypothetical protein
LQHLGDLRIVFRVGVLIPANLIKAPARPPKFALGGFYHEPILCLPSEVLAERPGLLLVRLIHFVFISPAVRIETITIPATFCSSITTAHVSFHFSGADQLSPER